MEIHVNHLFGVEVGDLCVYTNKCIHTVEDIKYDKDYVEQLLGKCESFFIATVSLARDINEELVQN